MPRILGMDYGERRIGLALSDLLGMTAQPLSVLERVSVEKDISALEVLVREHDVSRIVVGLPLNMDGTSGPKVAEAQQFGGRLGERLGVPVEYLDERLTTMQVERMLVEEADMSRQKRKGVRDKLAASIILQAYLDRQGR